MPSPIIDFATFYILPFDHSHYPMDTIRNDEIGLTNCIRILNEVVIAMMNSYDLLPNSN